MGKSGPGLQVINAGYPKTGTKTIHEALRSVFSPLAGARETFETLSQDATNEQLRKLKKEFWDIL